MIKVGLYSTRIMILCASCCRRDGNIEFDLREMYFENVRFNGLRMGSQVTLCVSIVMNHHIS